MAVFGVIMAGLFVLLPRQLTPILIFVATLNVLIVTQQATLHVRAAARVLGNVRVHRDWIDAAVGPNADVAAIWFPSRIVCATHNERARRAAAFWQNEFFNRGIRSVYYVVQPTPDGLTAQRVWVDAHTHLLRAGHGARFSPRFLAIGEGVRIHAPVVAFDPQTHTVLYRFDRNAHVMSSQHCPAFAGATVPG
jgi:hypothetical protein